ncbi:MULTISPECIES: DUF1365 domain-containing protein [unclassified Streptomyces]|uniref:DUF1365 domain-containing protein n=1 Tax=unclassified Streptomyces TaxID=2593676 RepID=UPI0013C94B4A|nr:DUF1365 domain-containing protein [Streptomyces sp. V17-9]NDZ74399.1 DUF1365 domain-containing protein [Streptomyces sp. SID10362]QUW95759.1 hypothetical protein KE639_07029 [Streptomyces sp. V17-9]
MTPAPTPRPGLYPCEIGHIRLDPIRYTLRHRTYMWLVDLDHLPELPLLLRPLAGFRPRDHFTGDAPSLRAGLERFLASRGIDLAGGRVLMLTHARVLGYVFNPLTLYWCHGPDGTPRCVVAEVHNTYGERHTYLLDPDEAGVAHVDKDFYVSPFFPVDGAYRMRLPLPADRLDLTVRLDRPGARPFTATVRGTRREATPAALLRLALRHPLSTLAVSAGIRRHGIRLYLRGLPVQPRPSHRTTEKAT